VACPDDVELTRFLRRDLDAERTLLLEEHFDGCSDCRALAFALATDGVASNDYKAVAPGAKLGRFVIDEQLGHGGMGIVYRAHDPELRRDVALKVLRVGPTPSAPNARDDDAHARLVREAQCLAQLDHPNVVTVFDVGTHDGEVFIAMELVDGVSLSAWLQEQQRPWRQIAAVLEQAARGLAAAHAVGLVHRDIKPSNVMISKQGRVKLVDFGLARAQLERQRAVTDAGADAHETHDSPSPRRSDRRPATPRSVEATRSGALVGTPAYASPEQLARGEVDAASDVFSFCVMSCEALFDVRPFVADTPAALLARMQDAPDLPAQPRLPAKLRARLRQGLAVDRAQRLSSIDPLAAALAAAPKRRQRVLIAVGAAALAITVPLVAIASTREEPANACAGLDTPPHGGFEPSDELRIHAGFVATGLPTAADTANRVSGALHGWRARAGELRASACRAARIERTESGELFDLRMQCLDASAHRVGALVDALSRPTRELVNGAVSAVGEATDLQLCSQARALLAPYRPPAEPSARKRFEELRGQLDAARAEHAAGRYADAIATATSIANAAHAAALPAIEAAAWQLAGQAHSGGTSYLAARESWQNALVACEAAGLERLRAELYLQLSQVENTLDRRPDAQRWVAQARGVIARLDDRGMRIALTYHEGLLALWADDYPTAIARISDAVRDDERTWGKRDDLHLAKMLDALGTALWSNVAVADAERTFGRALEMRERLLGPHHPALIYTLNMLGTSRVIAGRPSEGVPYLRRAYDIAERAAGPDANQIVHTAIMLATALSQADQGEQAIAMLDRALPIYERAAGANNSGIASALVLRGHVLTDLGRNDRALVDQRRAVEIQRRANPDTLDLAVALEGLGRTLQGAKRYDDAIAAYSESLAVRDRYAVASDRYYGEQGIGAIELDAGRPARAIPHLERAISARTGGENDPTELAEVQLNLARALIAIGGQQRRARELLEAARGVFAAAEGRDAAKLANIDAALARLR
jgi:eukaryotic-like serine/threonine-protein kinase